jgi:hypothetical protein
MFLVVVLCTLLGCRNDEHSIETERTSDSNSKPIEPSSQFVAFVKEVESANWISDTLRVNKVRLYNLDGLKIELFSERPFYNMSYENTQVSQYFLHNKNAKQKIANSILSKAQQVWGYFYRDKNGTGTISDGLVEQWSYTDSTEAQLALNHLKIHKGNIYFNLMPFFYRINNNVFIFHTRAMAFCYDQKPLYEDFVATNK